MKITIIGAGNIGGAIARGLAKGHMFKSIGYHLHGTIRYDSGENEEYEP